MSKTVLYRIKLDKDKEEEGRPYAIGLRNSDNDWETPFWASSVDHALVWIDAHSKGRWVGVRISKESDLTGFEWNLAKIVEEHCNTRAGV